MLNVNINSEATQLRCVAAWAYSSIFRVFSWSNLYRQIILFRDGVTSDQPLREMISVPQASNRTEPWTYPHFARIIYPQKYTTLSHPFTPPSLHYFPGKFGRSSPATLPPFLYHPEVMPIMRFALSIYNKPNQLKYERPIIRRNHCPFTT